MRDSEGFDPFLVANHFIELQPPNLILLKLIKLCYIAHCLYFARFDKPLSKEEPRAWIAGPIFKTVYTSFRLFFSPESVINRKTLCKGSLSSEAKEIIEEVNEKYGKKYNGHQLSALTRKKNTPWYMTFSKGYIEITDETIREYYRENQTA